MTITMQARKIPVDPAVLSAFPNAPRYAEVTIKSDGNTFVFQANLDLASTVPGYLNSYATIAARELGLVDETTRKRLVSLADLRAAVAAAA